MTTVVNFMGAEMRLFRITSTAAAECGVWAGYTKAHALARLHEAAGYDVSWDSRHDTVRWPSPELRELCGDVDDWCFDEIAFSMDKLLAEEGQAFVDAYDLEEAAS